MVDRLTVRQLQEELAKFRPYDTVSVGIKEYQINITPWEPPAEVLETVAEFVPKAEEATVPEETSTEPAPEAQPTEEVKPE